MPRDGHHRRSLKPRWDAKRGVLWFGGQVVKRYLRPAPNQTTILAAFQEEGWPEMIDDPIPGGSDDPKGRLHDTVKNLNQTLDGRGLRFHTCRFGQGVRWEALPAIAAE